LDAPVRAVSDPEKKLDISRSKSIAAMDIGVLRKTSVSGVNISIGQFLNLKVFLYALKG
jgi:hypothetical protein